MNVTVEILVPRQALDTSKVTLVKTIPLAGSM